MAALLKKRALAEYTQVVQVDVQPVKKLRLTQPQLKPQEPPINLKECGSTSEVLEQMFRLESLLPVSTETAEAVIAQMKAYFYPEQDEVVLSTIVSLFGKLGKLPNINTEYLCGDIITWVKNEKSHKLASMMIGTLSELGQSVPDNTALHQKLLTLAIRNLGDNCHLVRIKCLELIGCLGSPDTQIPGRSSQSGGHMIQTILGTFTMDNDPRVRSSAFQAMLTWHERGLTIEQTAYTQASNSLTDDYEGVRLCAVQLVWVLGQLYPDSLVKVASSDDEEIRLVDDGFAKICNMVNDVSMQVRARAASLLGSLHSVSARFLEQTLDKKLMSNMRRKTSAHQRQREHFQSGEWSTGQKWSDDKPKEDLDPDAVSLMSSGACGAFVHGLEDEFMEVRQAAIDSMCELGANCPGFAIQSQDFLVDMLNDEIDMVRLNAINSLRKMTRHIVLREDQLDSVLAVLKDFSFEIRESLRDLFGSVKLSTKSCINTCSLALLDNLRRYPEDRESVWNCMCRLGKNHAFLVMALAPELMSCHPYFESVEPDVEDPAYISILLLVLNATEACPTMASLFPEHAVRHYNYLKDTLPNLVPTLQLSPEAPVVVTPSTQCPREDVSKFMADTLKILGDLDIMDTPSALQLLDIGIRDLHNLPDMAPEISATARCHELYLHCQRLLLKRISCHIDPDTSEAHTVDRSVINSNLQQIYKHCNELSYAFLGLGTRGQLQVAQMRLRTHTLQLLLHLQDRAGGSKAACVDYVQSLNKLQRRFAQSHITPDSFTASLLSETSRLESCELPTFVPVLEASLHQHHCDLLSLTGITHQASAHILEPGHSDNPTRFIAGLTVSIPLVATLENLERVENVCVRIEYPDQKVQYTPLRPADLRQLSPLKHRLVTKILASHNKWSEACAVEVCLVLQCEAGQCVRPKQEQAASSSSPAVTYIELCKPVKTLLLPSGEKR